MREVHDRMPLFFSRKEKIKEKLIKNDTNKILQEI